MQIRTLLAGAVFAGVSLLGTQAPAGADSTCYTGCTTPTTGITTPAAPVAAPVAPSTPSTPSLAFTGADIEELALLGLAGIGIGSVLIRRRKTVQ